MIKVVPSGGECDSDCVVWTRGKESLDRAAGYEVVMVRV